MRKPLQALPIAGLFLAAAFATPRAAGAADGACGLVTAAEVQALLGTKVTGLTKEQTMGTAHICSGSASYAAVIVRLSKQTTETATPVTCSTLIPPKDQESRGFTTTCSVSKNGQVAALKIVTTTRANMVPVDKLKPLAEKIASRMP